MPDGTKLSHCPMSEFNEEYYNLVNLIFWSEEMHILPYEPNVLMGQSNVYVESRWVVVSHRSKIRYLKDKKEQEKNKAKSRKNITSPKLR